MWEVHRARKPWRTPATRTTAIFRPFSLSRSTAVRKNDQTRSSRRLRLGFRTVELTAGPESDPIARR
jgi:hypothetical protein